MRIDTAIARAALKNGFITIRDKGGEARDVPDTDASRGQLEKFLKLTPPGYKLFVPQDKQTHIAKTELQVSQLLGHERAEITKIYLASVHKRDEGG